MVITGTYRKILRITILVCVVASVMLGLKAMYIDLYNPGSYDARTLNSVVNWIFGFTILLSIPLLIEKIKKIASWQDIFENATESEKTTMLWNVVKPLLKKIGIVILLTIIASILISYFWQIPPDVMERYKNYYFGSSLSFP